MKDLTPEHSVEIVIREDGAVVWVNVDGECQFRACRVPNVVLVAGNEVMWLTDSGKPTHFFEGIKEVARKGAP